MRGLAWVARLLGLPKVFARYKSNRMIHWIFSLGAIHDLDKMIALDVPWWTYSSIAEVERFLAERRNLRVLEFGSGASTVWLSKRASHVTSIEHHKGWYDMLSKRSDFGDNIELRLREPKAVHEGSTIRSEKPGYLDSDFADYVTAARESAVKYDVIVIDGRARNACLDVAVEILNTGGLIIFDNTNRKRYKDAIATHDLSVKHYTGLVPSLPYFDSTTLITLNEKTSV